jgi:predicted DNA-binding protein (UPF0251 family)
MPQEQLQRVDLSLDEMEAIRLCYLEGLYQEDAAGIMNISRQTLGRVLRSANQKIADFLVNNKTLFINSGNTYLESGPRRHRRRRRGGCFGAGGYSGRGAEANINRDRYNAGTKK